MTDKTMDTRSNKKERNPVVKAIKNIGFIVFMIIMAILIFMAAQSKLMGQEPSLFGHRMYIVDSGSMTPALPINSMIIVKETTSSQAGANGIEKDDIVTFYAGSENTRVTHRVVEVLEDGQGYITRGDANNIEDANILQEDKIIGKLAFSLPYVGLIFRILSTKMGIAILIGLVAIIILIPMLFKKTQ